MVNGVLSEERQCTPLISAPLFVWAKRGKLAEGQCTPLIRTQAMGKPYFKS